MGAFTLTNGALLAGLALVAAPVIAHLLQRRARKPIVFPSIAFLQQTAAQQSRLHKLKRLFLLLLRAIAIACVVLAFARPVWWSTGLGAGERKAASATVFVIDTSLSTTQRASGTSVFERMKAIAIQEIDSLQQGIDVAGVVWAGDQSTSIFPRLTANLPELKAEAVRAVPGEGRADFPNAISLASRLLDTHSGPRRLVLLTDRQKTNWRPTGVGDASDMRVPSGVQLILPEVEVSAEPNLCLSSPTMQPERPVPESDVAITAVVSNHSEATRVIGVSAEWIDDAGSASVGTQLASIVPRQSSAVTLLGKMPRSAMPAVRWRLNEPDALAGDNMLWQTATSDAGVPVLIASDDSPDQPGTAAFYLSRALAPFDDQSESRSSYEPRHVITSRFVASDLNDVRVVFLGYSGVIRQELASALAKFVERGGALVIVAGDGPADRNVQLLDEAARGELLPWRLLVRTEAPKRTPIVIDSGRWNSRQLRDFDEPSQLALRGIAFRRVWQAGPLTKGAEVLLSFHGGQPAMGLRHFGRGQCLVLNFSPEATTGDLGKTGTFVALLQMLTSQLVHNNRDRSTFLVGDRLTFQMPRDVAGAWAVVDPAGRSQPIPVAAGAGAVVGPRATTCGIYQLTCDGQTVSARAVNSNPLESDLT
ncbi:MAG TPA: BatA and WFA domain-containing protein, partial [Caulifigura sp.]|nr:BatA and WFA domain-containing protein [Caulifigura sp.]